MEQLDPATLVDRIANGLLRSLRGDPEDRSGRVRIQLARMAPEVQDSVLDRLELRLPAPAVDRLLENVEETEQAGPLPTDDAVAPLAVPGALEEIEQERAREDSATEPAPGQDARPNESGEPAGKPQDGRTTPGGEQEEEAGNQDGEPDAAAADQDNAQGSAGAAGRQQQGSEAEQERSQEQQDDKGASARDAEKDAGDERKDASDTEREQRDQDQQDEREAEQDEGGPEDEAAQEPETQAGEQERREDEAPASRSQAPAPGTVDRSGAEPGEKSRTGGDTGAARTVGDPDNEQGVDDEPLGLDAEPAQDDTERERGDDEAGAAGAQPVPDADLVGYTDAAKNPNLVEERRKGTAPLPSLPSASGPPAPDTAAQDGTPGAAPEAEARSGRRTEAAASPSMTS